MVYRRGFKGGNGREQVYACHPRPPTTGLGRKRRTSHGCGVRMRRPLFKPAAPNLLRGPVAPACFAGPRAGAVPQAYGAEPGAPLGGRPLVAAERWSPGLPRSGTANSFLPPRVSVNTPPPARGHPWRRKTLGDYTRHRPAGNLKSAPPAPLRTPADRGEAMPNISRPDASRPDSPRPDLSRPDEEDLQAGRRVRRWFRAAATHASSCRSGTRGDPGRAARHPRAGTGPGPDRAHAAIALRLLPRGRGRDGARPGPGHLHGLPRAGLRRRAPGELRALRLAGTAAGLRPERLRRGLPRCLGGGREAAGGQPLAERPCQRAPGGALQGRGRGLRAFLPHHGAPAVRSLRPGTLLLPGGGGGVAEDRAPGGAQGPPAHLRTGP